MKIIILIIVETRKNYVNYFNITYFYPFYYYLKFVFIFSYFCDTIILYGEKCQDNSLCTKKIYTYEHGYIISAEILEFRTKFRIIIKLMRKLQHQKLANAEISAFNGEKKCLYIYRHFFYKNMDPEYYVKFRIDYTYNAEIFRLGFYT